MKRAAQTQGALDAADLPLPKRLAAALFALAVCVAPMALVALATGAWH